MKTNCLLLTILICLSSGVTLGQAEAINSVSNTIISNQGFSLQSLWRGILGI